MAERRGLAYLGGSLSLQSWLLFLPQLLIIWQFHVHPILPLRGLQRPLSDHEGVVDLPKYFLLDERSLLIGVMRWNRYFATVGGYA